MAEEEDFSKLPLDVRLAHKHWRARKEAHEELAVKVFPMLDPESNDFTKYIPTIRKLPVEPNAAAQEAGLGAVLAFVSEAACVSRVTSDVVSGIVAKCLNARPKTKEKAVQVCLMLVEMEQGNTVMEELVKGLANKQPKIVASSAEVMADIIRDFGVKVFDLKPVIKCLASIFGHQDKNVRSQGQRLAVELYRYIGQVLLPHLESLKPLQKSELDIEFGKLPPGSARPTRLRRSEQSLPEGPEYVDNEGEEESDDVGGIGDKEIDAFSLLDPVNVLDKLPPNTFQDLVEKKWQIRKEALERIEELTRPPKLAVGDYRDLVRALGKLISDVNVNVVIAAANCIRNLARGLRTDFGPYTSMVIGPLIARLKEKKATVLTALGEALDATYLSTTVGNIIEDLSDGLKHKNPSVKKETGSFLVRAFKVTPATALPRPLLKTLCELLMLCMNDSAGEVREAAFEAFGTMMKVVGETIMQAFLDQLDAVKVTKVKEYFAKAEVKAPAAVKKNPVSKVAARVKDYSAKSEMKTQAPAAVKKTAVTKVAPVRRAPVAAPVLAKTVEKRVQPTSRPTFGGATTVSSSTSSRPMPSASQTSSVRGQTGKPKAPQGNSEEEGELTEDDVAALATALVPYNIWEQLTSATWKERLAAMVEVVELVQTAPSADLPAQAIIRMLARQPGFKETNFQVLAKMFEVLCIVADRSRFTAKAASYAIPGIVDKIGDIKLRNPSMNALKLFAEVLTLNFVSLQVSKAVENQKNPRNIAAALSWLSESLNDFGMKIAIKPHLEYLKTCLQNVNPAVRKEAVVVLGTLRVFEGLEVRAYFEDEKPALLQVIDKEFEKVSNCTPPAPTRTERERVMVETPEEEDPDTDMIGELPRIDISSQCVGKVLDNLGDMNWRVRGEGLDQVASIIHAAGCHIEPNLGELPSLLRIRLNDTNKNLVPQALNLTGLIATSTGPAAEKYLKTLMPGILSCLSDNKITIRTAALGAVTAFEAATGLAPLVTGGYLGMALLTESPTLRKDLLSWLVPRLDTDQGIDLTQLIDGMLACLEDRMATVKKLAQGLLPAVMTSCGYDVVCRHVTQLRLRPAAHASMMASLERFGGSRNQTQAKPHETVDPYRASSQPSARVPLARPGLRPALSRSTAPSSMGSRMTAKPQPEASDRALLMNDGKRMRMENGRRTKWEVDGPRDDLVPLLKQEMIGCIGKMVYTQLWSGDFRQVQGVLEALSACMMADSPGGGLAVTREEVEANSDLLLKYISLRLFDNNTTIILKCVEFLLNLFSMLGEDRAYSISDYEVSLIFPALLARVGDKDMIRREVRRLWVPLTNIYSPSKLFAQLLEGLKSKNARTRKECVEELGALVEKYGINVCQPTTAKVLQVIANIGLADRDTAVRSATLATIVKFCNIIGSARLWAMVGNLPAREMALLAEHIERAMPSYPPAQPSPSPVNHGTPLSSGRVSNQFSSIGPVYGENGMTSFGSGSHSRAAPLSHSPFTLDLDPSLLPAGAAAHRVSAPLGAPSAHLDRIASPSQPRPTATSVAARAHGHPGHTGHAGSRPAQTNVDLIVDSVAHPDPAKAITALRRIVSLVRQGPEAQTWSLDTVDRLLENLTVQLHNSCILRLSEAMHSQDQYQMEEAVRLVKHTINTLMFLYNKPEGAALVLSPPQDTVHKLLAEVLNRLDWFGSVSCTLSPDEGQQIVRCLNSLAASILNATDSGLVLRILLCMLTAKAQAAEVAEVVLVTRCLMRVIEQLHHNPTRAKALDWLSILGEINIFLEAHPPMVWEQQSQWRDEVEDRPLRACRALLSMAARMHGSQCLVWVDQLGDHDTDALQGYLLRYISKGEKERASRAAPTMASPAPSSERPQPSVPSYSSPVIKAAPPPVTPATPVDHRTDYAEILEKIFLQISSTSETQKGLQELYDFREQYADAADLIDARIKQTSSFFQGYITRNLEGIAEKRAEEAAMASATLTNRGAAGLESNPLD
eukprot:Ihof_evm3s259 gene=Ihof_evmTU3s259